MTTKDSTGSAVRKTQRAVFGKARYQLSALLVSWLALGFCTVSPGAKVFARVQTLQRPLSPNQSSKVLEGWYERLREAHHQLVEVEDYETAYRQLTRLISQMNNRLLSGPEVGQILGPTIVERAVAASLLEREDEALWHWHVATQMFPPLLDFNLEPFGETGIFLKANILPTQDAPEDKETAQNTGEDTSLVDVTPPRRIRSPKPQIPQAKKGTGRVSVVVEAIVSLDGRLREPRIVEARGELTLVYSTLDTLRRWRFEPALVDGEPAEVSYRLTVNFKT